MDKQTVLNLIKLHKKDNPITKKQIMFQAGISDERIVRKYVEELRKAGKPIATSSHSKGYYYALTREEMLPFINDLKSRIRNMAETVRYCEEIFAEEHQMELVMGA